MLLAGQDVPIVIYELAVVLLAASVCLAVRANSAFHGAEPRASFDASGAEPVRAARQNEQASEHADAYGISPAVGIVLAILGHSAPSVAALHRLSVELADGNSSPALPSSNVCSISLDQSAARTLLTHSGASDPDSDVTRGRICAARPRHLDVAALRWVVWIRPFKGQDD